MSMARDIYERGCKCPKTPCPFHPAPNRPFNGAMTPTEKELEQAFEDWATKHPSITGGLPQPFLRTQTGEYKFTRVRDAYDAWMKGRADGQREVFERCCKTMCPECADDEYYDAATKLSYADGWWHIYKHGPGNIRCLATPMRAAFPQFSKPGEGQ